MARRPKYQTLEQLSHVLGLLLRTQANAEAKLADPATKPNHKAALDEQLNYLAGGIQSVREEIARRANAQ